MHEYSLMQQVIEEILKRLDQPPKPPGQSVREVTLKVGALDVHSELSFRQAFEILVQDTVLEESRLTLSIIPATMKCPKCGRQEPCPDDQVDGHDPDPWVECPSCGTVSAVLGGRGVQSIELVLDDRENH